LICVYMRFHGEKNESTNWQYHEHHRNTDNGRNTTEKQIIAGTP
jgi:hypothetical protein